MCILFISCGVWETDNGWELERYMHNRVGVLLSTGSNNNLEHAHIHELLNLKFLLI